MQKFEVSVDAFRGVASGPRETQSYSSLLHHSASEPEFRDASLIVVGYWSLTRATIIAIAWRATATGHDTGDAIVSLCSTAGDYEF